MNNDKINVLVVEPGKKPYAKEISSELASLQHEVGGYIQAVYPYEEPVAIVCDEEAKLTGKELNRVLRDGLDKSMMRLLEPSLLLVWEGRTLPLSLTNT